MGKLRVITRNDNILLPRSWDDGDESAIGNYYGAAVGADNLSNGVYFMPHYHGTSYVGGLYGMPGGVDDCYYRIDMENRQIVFSGATPRSEVVMEYISSGVRTDGSSLVPREAVPALRTYVLLAMVENDQRVAFNEKERRKREHEEAVAALRFFQNSFTAAEYRQMVLQSYSQAPKR